MNEITKPTASVTRRYASMLTRPEGWRPEPLATNAKLIPLGDCNAIIAEMTAALAGMTASQATAMARKLMGAYPARAVNDAKTFAEFSALAFSRCPLDLGRDVIAQLTARLVFLPTCADITEEVQAVTRDRRTALAVARIHMAEHSSRGNTPFKQGWKEASPEKRAEIDEMLRRLKGMPAGPEEARKEER